MFPLLFLGLFTVPGALGALVLTGLAKRARMAVVASTFVMSAGLCAVLLAAIGKLSAMRAIYAAMALVSPEDRATLVAAGTAESRVVLVFGLLLGVPALLCGALCL